MSRSRITALVVASFVMPAGAQDLLVQKGHQGEVTAVAFSPDGRWVASGGLDGTTRLWDPATSELARELPPRYAHVTDLAFAADGKHLLVGQVNGKALFYGLGEHRHLLELDAFDAGGYCGVAVSADGRLLAAGCDGEVAVLERATGKVVRRWKGPRRDRFWSVAFDPAAEHLAAASDVRTVYVWRVSDGALAGEIQDDGGDMRRVQFHGDGERVFTLDRTGRVRAWRWKTAERTSTWGGAAMPVTCFALDPKCRRLALGTATGCTLVDLEDGKEIMQLGAPVTAAALDSAGERLAVGREDGVVEVFEVATGRRHSVLRGRAAWPKALGVTARGAVRVALSLDGRPTVVELGAGRSVWKADGTRSLPASFAFSAGATQLCFGDAGGAPVRLVDLDATKVREVEGAVANGALAMDPGVKTLALRRSQDEVELHALTGGKVGSLPGLGEPDVLALAWSPDGAKIAMSGKGNGIRIHAVPGGEVLARRGGSGVVLSGTSRFEGAIGWVASLAFSGDGRHLLCGGPYSALTLRTADDLRLVHGLTGHVGTVVAVAFGPDSSRMLSAGAEGAVRIWERETGAHLATVVVFDTADWIVVATDGRWDASPGAAAFASWTARTQDGWAVKPLDDHAGQRSPDLLAALVSGR